MSRTGGALLAAVSAAVLSGCGSSDTTAADAAGLPPLGPVVAAAPTTGAPITEATTLRERLLDDGDLPAGMVQAAASDPASSATAGQAHTEPAECGRILQPLARQRPDASTRSAVAFNGPNFSSIDIDAATYSNDKLPSAFADFQSVLRRCGKYSGTDADETSIDYRLGGLAQPSVGDASTAYQLRLTSEGFTLVSLVGLVQVGNTLVQVSVTAPESVDPGVLEDVTAAQVRRLSAPATP
ncbi:hypothetical protein [Nocardia arizonensis]|uniref:hypothetical protein n=1 Tax=Nocardia arizonensis TaxID=1141647 RepID=UPI000AA1B267|nr:hypothetical protein [Nocardia arizonensis]